MLFSINFDPIMLNRHDYSNNQPVMNVWRIPFKKNTLYTDDLAQ